MKATTVRFPDRIHELIATAAASDGTTFAMYVRQATIMRAAYDAGLLAGAMLATLEGDGAEAQLEAARQGCFEAMTEWLDKHAAG